MKKKFIVTVEYPDCDTIPTEEFIEVLYERMEFLEDYFDANIMDGEKGRLTTTVEEITRQ